MTLSRGTIDTLSRGTIDTLPEAFYPNTFSISDTTELEHLFFKCVDSLILCEINKDNKELGIKYDNAIALLMTFINYHKKILPEYIDTDFCIALVDSVAIPKFQILCNKNLTKGIMQSLQPHQYYV